MGEGLIHSKTVKIQWLQLAWECHSPFATVRMAFLPWLLLKATPTPPRARLPQAQPPLARPGGATILPLAPPPCGTTPPPALTLTPPPQAPNPSPLPHSPHFSATWSHSTASMDSQTSALSVTRPTQTPRPRSRSRPMPAPTPTPNLQGDVLIVTACNN